ncbi:MAG TPA: hypothetical protein VJ725_18135, partial [Thermoanaerobaculia bacterium]|nr:hypothetical protein [Thermoanaerobaculia bacterium]
MIHPVRCFTLTILLFASVSAALAQKLCFPPHEGLPHHGGTPPVIDGYIDRAVGYPTDELETGWVRSSLVTYDAGSTVTLTNFRGLKDNSGPFLYLGFTVQFDQTFDDDDVIVLVLRPSFAPAAHSAQERRIDIYPVQNAIGGVPAGPDDAPPGSMPSEHIRTNRSPRNVEYYKWDTVSNSYVAISPISNIGVKVRSWSNTMTDNSWGVEIKLPITSAGALGGGPNWIDLTSNFGLYFNVIRVCNGAVCGPSVLENNYTTQFPWPRAVGPTGILVDPMGGPLPTLASYEIPPGWLGEGVIGGGAGTCQGVHFVNGPSGIGTRDPANPSGPLSGSIDGMNNNTFVARVINDGTSAPNVRAEFRIANWGLGPGDPGVWKSIPLSAPPPALSTPQTVGNSQVELTKDWQLTAAERAMYGPGKTLNDHQCLWVLLSSTSSVDFSESSVRRNMDFKNLSSCS